MAEVYRKPVTADIIFLLDGSQYVGKPSFNYEKTFIKAVVRRLKISWRKSHITVATYGKRAQLRMSFKKHFRLGRALRAISGISYPQDIQRRVYRALKTSLGLFSGFVSRKILVAVVDARQLRQPWSLISRLSYQLRSQGAKLFLAAVGMTRFQAVRMNRLLQSIARGQKKNIFLFPVPWFGNLVADAPFIAKVIRKKTVRLLRSYINAIVKDLNIAYSQITQSQCGIQSHFYNCICSAIRCL